MDREESINEILSYYSGRKDKKEQETVAAMLRELQEACGGRHKGFCDSVSGAYVL